MIDHDSYPALWKYNISLHKEVEGLVFNRKSFSGIWRIEQQVMFQVAELLIGTGIALMGK